MNQAILTLELALLQGGIILLLGTLTAVLLRWRRRAEEERRLLWCAVWFALAAIPLAGPLIPTWAPFSLPSPQKPPVPPPLPLVSTRPATEMPPTQTTTTLPADIATPDAEAGTTPAPPDRDTAGFWLLLLWGVGASLMAARLLLSQSLLLRLSRRSHPAPQAWQNDLQEVARALALRRTPRIAQSPAVTIPITWGFFRPIIVIPPSAGDLPEEQRRFVLDHECQHVRRHDVRWLTLAQATLCLHWINPLAWWALSRLRFAQEQTCDDALITSQPGNAAPYAEFLLQTAKQHATTPQTLSSGLFRPLALAVFSPRMSLLKNRLTHILNTNMNRSTTNRRRSTILILIACISVGLASLSWRSEIQAHDTADNALLAALEATALESVKFENESPPDVIKFLQDELGKLKANVVVLREAQDRLITHDSELSRLRNLVGRQSDRTEVARLEMLDFMQKHRITSMDEASHLATHTQSEGLVLQTEIRVHQEKRRLKKLINLPGEMFLRHAIAEENADPLLVAASKAHQEARAATGSNREAVEEEIARSQKELEQQIAAAKDTLSTKIEMLDEEYAILEELQARNENRLHDYKRREGAFENAKRHYELQRSALEALRERKLNAELETAPPRITLDLRDVSLADAMTYALQLGGMGYRVRKNTVVIGTPTDLESF